MKKPLFIILLISTINFGCKKDLTTDPANNPPAQIHTNYIVLIIARAYVGFDDTTRTDTILSTSYWGKNGGVKYLPSLSTISDSGAFTPSGYEQYQDTIDVAAGDLISLHLDLKHRWDYTFAQGGGSVDGGIYVSFLRNPGLNIHGQFMCLKDTLSQTITYTVN